jgi:hypothetical protein
MGSYLPLERARERKLRTSDKSRVEDANLASWNGVFSTGTRWYHNPTFDCFIYGQKVNGCNLGK